MIDVFSKAVGHAFSWCVLVLTASTCYEVFMRYVLNDPTVWAFDMSYILYGALFIMSGAYALSRGSHVRGDFIYRKWKPRTQAKVDLVLYFLFFFPAIFAMVFTGARYSFEATRILESSVNSPAGRAGVAAQADHLRRRPHVADRRHRRGDALRDLHP